MGASPDILKCGLMRPHANPLVLIERPTLWIRIVCYTACTISHLPNAIKQMLQHALKHSTPACCDPRL